MTASWQLDESFPSANLDWQAWRPPMGRCLEGEIAVRRAIRTWHPFDPLLVSTPEGRYMLPPIFFTSLEQELVHRVKARYRLLLMLCLLMALAFGGIGTVLLDSYLLKCGFVMASLLALASMQYTLMLASRERMQSCSRFCAWCYLQPKVALTLLAAVPILGAIGQIFLQVRAGSLFAMVEQYGLLFSAVSVEPWRFLTGPFFHAGIVHWIGNFSLWLVTAGLALCLGRVLTVWATCLAGAFLPPFLLAFLPHWVGSDAFVGLSGGVFALLGWLAATTWLARGQLPHGLWTLIGFFAVVSATASSLLDPRASGFVHASSALLGLLVGSTGVGLKMQFLRSDLAAKQ